MKSSIKKTLKFVDQPEQCLTIKFSPQSSSILRDFLETDYLPSENQLIWHLGDPTKLTDKKIRTLGGNLIQWVINHNISEIYLDDEDLTYLNEHQFILPLFEGLFYGGYKFEKYQTNNTVTEKQIEIKLGKQWNAVNTQLKDITKIAEALNYARDLGNEPANVINPVSLAAYCEELSTQYNLNIKTLTETDLAEIHAGGILSVGQGSKHKSRMIIIEHPGKDQNQNPYVLVGKAITFDTGGYSLKSVDGIQGMKYDKLGGVAVIGFMIAASLLNLPQRIVGIVCAAENSISEEAYKPDDIITTLSGKTVEILSTDAEGRLVLADGITYAQSNFEPQAVIDFATLTGGIVTALGSIRAGLFSNQDQLANDLFVAGEKASEKLWRMPLDDEYFDSIKGDFADIKNSGGRKAHPIMGGIFLKQFVKDETPWAHIDIAGTASNEKADSLNAKGANGFGIKLLVQYFKQIVS